MSDEVSAHVARELFLRGFLGAASSSVPGDTAARIAKRVEDLWLPAGKTLYTAGEPADEHYYLVTGEIEITDPTRQSGPARRLGERSMVGILDVAQERPRTRTAVAVADTHLLRLRAYEWFDVLEEDFEFARGAVHNIASGVMKLHVALEGRGFEGREHERAGDGIRVRRGPLSFVDRTLLLRKMPAFRHASVQTAVDLVPHTELRALDDGAALFERGAAKTSIFVVANGTIALESEKRSIASFGPATLLGGIGCVTPDAWPVGARAAGGPARVLELDYEDVFDAMEEHFDLVKACIGELAREREYLQRFDAETTLHPAG